MDAAQRAAEAEAELVARLEREAEIAFDEAPTPPMPKKKLPLEPTTFTARATLAAARLSSSLDGAKAAAGQVRLVVWLAASLMLGIVTYYGVPVILDTSSPATLAL